MKKEYIEPMLDALRLEEMQSLMNVSLVDADPEQTTDDMDAKESYGGWFNADEN